MCCFGIINSGWMDGFFSNIIVLNNTLSGYLLTHRNSQLVLMALNVIQDCLGIRIHKNTRSRF